MPPLIPIKDTLVKLDLGGNDLAFIESNYFKGFCRLITLFLSFNHLSAIPDITFLASSLKNFDISDNSLLSLKPVLSEVSYLKLARLVVSYNNISELTAFMLTRWPRLEHLAIEHNLLETLEDLSGITRVTILKVLMKHQVACTIHHHLEGNTFAYNRVRSLRDARLCSMLDISFQSFFSHRWLWICSATLWGRLSIKMLSYPYGDSHYKNETVWRLSHFIMGIPIPGKTVYILRGVQTLESWVWAGSMYMTPNWQMARNISYTSNICIYI